MPGKGGWRAGGGTRSVVIAHANGVAPVGLPPAPSWLSSSGKLEYRKLARELVASGIATRLDAVVVAAHADAVSRLMEATSALASSGPLMRGRDGLPVASPWVKLARDARVEVLRTAAELGLTPAARGRVKMADVDDTGMSPIARLMQRRAEGREWWDISDAPDPAADDGEEDG